MGILRLYQHPIIFPLNIFMSKIEAKVLCGYIIFLLTILFIVSFTGCDSGWTIAGWEVK